MKLSNRLTSGLAWAGLALVVGVPVADFATSKLSPTASSLAMNEAGTPAAVSSDKVAKGVVLQSAPVKAPVNPGVAPAPTTPPKVAKVPSASKVPSYISDTPAAVAAAKTIAAPAKTEAAIKPAAAVPAKTEATTKPAAAPAKIEATAKPVVAPVTTETAVAEDDVPVLEIAPESQAPNARATSSVPAATTTSKPVPVAPQVATVEPRPMPPPQAAPVSAPATGVASTQPALSVSAPVEPQVTRVAPVPLPPSARPAPRSVASVPRVSGQGIVTDDPQVSREPIVVPRDIEQESELADIVSEEDLEDWESGPLSDFLAERRNPRRERRAQRSRDDYDSDGFFLDELPPRSRFAY